MTVTPELPSGWLPTPHQLERAPQLAILVALDSTLEVAICALQVAHPELDDDPESPYWVARPDRHAAEKLLELIDRLRTAIARYRKALPDPPPADTVLDHRYDDDLFGPDDCDDEIPF
jgi:hypothetical protein